MTQNQKPKEKYIFYAIKAQDQKEQSEYYIGSYTIVCAQTSKSRKLFSLVDSGDLKVFDQK